MSTIHGSWRGALGGRSMVLLALLVLAPVVFVLTVRDPSQSSADLVQLTGVVTCALVLGSAVFVYFHWRVDADGADRRLSGWLVIGLVVFAAHGLIQYAVPAGERPGADRWPLISQLATVWLLVLVAHLSRHVGLRRDPAVVGTALAAGLALAFVTASLVLPMHLSGTISALVETLIMLGGLVLALGAVTHTDLPRPMRYHLAVAAVALTGAQCAADLQGHHRMLQDVAVLASVLGATALCSMTQRLLHRTVTRHQSEVRVLTAALADARDGVRADRELLHEMTSTIAGITTASELIQSDLALNPGGRERLERMLQAELARLGRLSSDRAGILPLPQQVDIDLVVEPVVVSHWLRGRDVRWVPSHVRAEANSDDIAAVLNILLENAHRHAPGATVTIDVEVVHGLVEISCADDGPGVDREVRDQIFLSGVRGPDSPGQGLGLAMARRILARRGGTLDLVEARDPDHTHDHTHDHGARFVARFPQFEGADVHRDHVA